LNKLLMHYGSSSSLGIHTQVLMEMLVIEGGSPFRSYWSHFPNMVSRLHTAGCNQCGRRSKIRELPLQFPREGDSWIMRAFALLGFNGNDLLCLNRVRCNQQVLFISNVFNASGRAVDRKYLAQQPAEETWSTLIFPQERPPRQDFNLWQQGTQDLALAIQS
jgi:hypothetical protein